MSGDVGYVAYDQGSALDRLTRGLDAMVLGAIMSGTDIESVGPSSMFVLGLRLGVEFPEYGRAWVDYLNALREGPVEFTFATGLMRDIPIEDLAGETAQALMEREP